MIQLSRLEAFYRVARQGGYARAARAFSYPITQPAVYQQVRKLEQEVGVQLLERVAKDRVEPTAAGRLLYEFCAPFLDELPAVLAAIRSGEHGGTLRIDAGALELVHIMPAWVQRLRRLRPDIDVELFEAPVADAQRLLSHRTDLLVEHLPELPPGIACRRVGTHRAFLVFPRAWFPRQPPSAARLADKPFVRFHTDLPQSRLQLDALARRDITPPKLLSATSTEGILGLVGAGLGYSVVPWPHARPPRFKGVRAVGLRGAEAKFPIMAAWRAGPVENPLVQAALDAMPPSAAP